MNPYVSFAPKQFSDNNFNSSTKKFVPLSHKMGICLSSMVFDTNRVSALNSIKRKVSDEDNEHRPANVASTAGLQMLLQQQFLRERFRDFVSAHWVPANDNNDFSSFSACDPRLIALNCIEFWTDVQDFSFIEHSPFQQYRACYIYEKYIMHGAANLVRIKSHMSIFRRLQNV